MRLRMKLRNWMIASLMMVLLAGCGALPEVMTGLSAAANAYSAHVDSKQVTYSKECLSDNYIYLDEGFEDRWTREEKEQVLAWNRAREENCPE